jgi:Zn-dependent peptidase ImmA (M78 family)/transcriptional regulator with XRE-family HTH domain
MPTPLDDISPVEVGERLRLAREAAKLKQADVASSLDIARTTLVAIEKGERRVRIGELQKLAQIYRTSVNALLRTEAVQVDLAPQFRRLGQLNDATERATELLSDLAKAEVELENLLGVKRIRNYPPERPILPGDVRAQAEQDALELRKWLGLGVGPVTDLITLLEMEMGVRVYVRRIPGPVSGLFAYDDAVGACILINANHPRDRRTLTAAHEMAHLISTRRQAEILGGHPVKNSREERYASAFASAFLTPARTVMQKFQEITAGSQTLTRRHVIVLAHTFGVSREAVVRRLEELGLTKNGTWEWFQQNGGITDDQAVQVLGDIPAPDTQKAEADKPTTLRLGLLAGEAWRRGLLSEGQLSRMLHIDRVDLRRMFDGLEIEGSEADGALLPD